MSEQPRRKGRFETKKKIQWKENVIAGAKRRKLSREENVDDIAKVDGQRIMNIKRLADDMWCQSCNAALSFRHVENENILGLASIFHIRCQNCQMLKRVDSSNRASAAGDNRKRLFDINYKAAIGIIDGGIGVTQLNTVLSTMNIPTVHSSTLKRYERSVGVAIEATAKESCVEAIIVEKDLSRSIDTSDAVQEEGPVTIAASYDAAWPKRGNGHTYNSLAALGTLIGTNSGKVLAYGTRTKHCRLCQAGHCPDDHDCRLNWTGSAKAMEPDIAVEIVAKNKDLEEHNVRLGTLIGDDDSSTIAAVRRECSHPVAKWSDLNHATKKLSKALWAQKIPRDVIEYLKYCFGCALKKNKGDVEATEKAIKNIVPHAFDEHDNCGEWCRYAKDPNNYTHSGLPGGKGLTGQTMRQTLTAIFDVFWKNADKLAPCGSSQANEAFNSSVSAKSSKAHHYAGSESFDFRVAATVCEKNIGTTYIVDVNKKLGLSPGKVTEEFRNKKDHQRAKRKERAMKPEIKRRRLFRQKHRSNKKGSAERKEGITYSSECGFDGIAELIDSPTVSRTAPEESPLVYFDLETTGLSIKHSEICQIAARYNDQEFSACMVPLRSISKNAADVTGLSVRAGEMFLHGEKVETTPFDIALQNFLQWLRQIGKDITLVAHNGFAFDSRFIIRDMRAYNLWAEFSSIVYGFTDTLHVLKSKLPSRTAAKLKFTQIDLASDLLGENVTAEAHNALNDVKILQRIVDKAEVTHEELMHRSKSVTAMVQTMQRSDLKNTNKITMDCMQGSVSAGMIGKMAEAGITLELLQRAYQKGNDKGVELLLGEDIGGRPRVTKNKKVLRNVISKVKETIESTKSNP